MDEMDGRRSETLRQSVPGAADDTSPTDNDTPAPQSPQIPRMSHGGQATVPAGVRRQPTDEDYGQYISHLMNIESFLQNLDEVVSSIVACEGNEELVNDLVADNIDLLHVYKNDIRQIRTRVQMPETSAPAFFVEKLQETEALFQRFSSRFSQLNTTMTSASLSPGVELGVGSAGNHSSVDSRTLQQQYPVVSSTQPVVTVSSASKPSYEPPVTAAFGITNASGDGTTAEPARSLRKLKIAKPDSTAPVATPTSGLSLDSWVDDWNSKNEAGHVTTWRFDRHSHDFLQVVLEKYDAAQPRELQRGFRVFFENEPEFESVDSMKELFFICFQRTTQEVYKGLRLMIGQTGHILPDTTPDYCTKAFECLGMMIAHAVRHGCHGFPGLSPAIRAYIVHGTGPAYIEESSPPISIDDVAEDDIRHVLTKVQEGDNLNEKEKNLIQHWLERSDCRAQLNPQTRALVVQHILIYYIFKRRICQIDALAKGMETLGLRQFLRENPTDENMEKVFPSPNVTRTETVSRRSPQPPEPATKTIRRAAFDQSTWDDAISMFTSQTGESLEVWIDDHNSTKGPGETKWRFDRHSHDFLQVAFEKYKCASLRELQRNFQVFFDKEQGIDRGALTREFYYVCFEDCTQEKYKNLKLMVGEKGHVLPDATADHCIEAFECLGMMIAHAVRHGCHGFPGLSPAIQAYIVHGTGPAYIEESSPPISIDDVAEDDIRHALTKLQNGEALIEKEDALIQDWLKLSDSRTYLSNNTRHLIVQQILIFYVFKKRIRQIDALAKGMETLGLRQFLRENPTKENMNKVFPSPAVLIVSSDLFKGAVVVRGELYDQMTWDFFDQFLQELSADKIENHSMSDLITFLSGSPYLPSQVVITFSDTDDVMPIAHACFNELVLPTKHQRYEPFRDCMLEGMMNRDYALDREPESELNMHQQHNR